ncbi:MAG: hypothetical protein ACI97B_001541, partial [Verrucomicrobiales bacterium]
GFYIRDESTGFGWATNELIQAQSVSALTMGAATNVQFTFTAPNFVGPYYLRAYVDTHDSVPEVMVGNNT